MPRSKHRRKPGGKAVRHPGRITKVQPEWKLIDARDRACMREAYENLAPGRMAPELIEEFKRLNARANRVSLDEDLPTGLCARLAELERIAGEAVPDELVENYLINVFGYGTAERPLPEEYFWE